MDEKTLQKIDELVEAFRRAPDEVSRREVTAEAERSFQFIPGALEQFAGRVEEIGDALFTPGVLDMDMLEDRPVLQDDTQDMGGVAEQPVAGSGRVPGRPGAAMPAAAPGPMEESSYSWLTPGYDAIELERQAQQDFPGVQEAIAEENIRRETGATRAARQALQGENAMANFQEWRKATEAFALLAEYGYTGQQARNVYDQFKEQAAGQAFVDWARSGVGVGERQLTRTQIQDTIAAWAAGDPYTAYQVQAPGSVPPRMATIDGVTRMTDRVGLVGRDGEFLRDDAGNIIPAYDANAVSNVLYNQLSQDAYWDLADRLYNIGLLEGFAPAQIESAVGSLLSEATRYGYTYDNLLYQKEKTLGVGNGMTQPRIGPRSSSELNVYENAAQEAAEAVFGRRLYDDELRGVLAEYEVMRREQPYYSRTGAMTPSGQVFNIESATDQWLRENRPEQYKKAQQAGMVGGLYDLAMDGFFSE